MEKIQISIFRTGQRCSFEIEHVNFVFQIHKTFVMTIYVSSQTHKLLKTFVMTIYVSCQTHKVLNTFVMTIYMSCQTSKFLKYVRHALQKLYTVGSYWSRKFLQMFAMTIFVSCQTHECLKMSVMYLGNSTFFVSCRIRIYTRSFLSFFNLGIIRRRS